MSKETELKIKVLEKAGFCDVTEEDVKKYEKCDYLTENVGRNGKLHYWYSDDEHEICLCVETEDFLTEEEIEENFC